MATQRHRARRGQGAELNGQLVQRGRSFTPTELHGSDSYGDSAFPPSMRGPGEAESNGQLPVQDSRVPTCVRGAGGRSTKWEVYSYEASAFPQISMSATGFYEEIRVRFGASAFPP